ncbi:MAG: LutB/LldF family L-lactate oxidation iron-sulfur protein [Ktedonobacteraceae bacterium]
MSVSLRQKRLPMFQQEARKALEDTQLRHNLGKATHTIRNKRNAVVAEVPDWEELREAARQIKDRVNRHMDTYLLQFEEAVTQAGGIVHWARDAQEANAIITGLIQMHDAREVVKIKSMVTNEIGLNDALAKVGIQAHETDLAEMIVQLAHDDSSHIVVPAIHKNRAQVEELFRANLDDVDTTKLTDDPTTLAMAAREHLRTIFLRAKVAISGVNFGVAETGSICIVESEGNGRMCLTLPDVLISIMGIEKLVPTWQDLEVFLQLLPRSATGERMNPYTSVWTGVQKGDGPQEFHLVLLDNGRTQVLADPVGRQALHCIRCGACLNVCPVYERVGGHAYSSVYPGPIGAILTPQLLGIENASSLPYASTLCGACYETCPVKINIPEVLLHLRGQIVRQEQQSMLHRDTDPENLAMQAALYVLEDPQRLAWVQRLARIAQLPFARRGMISQLPGPLAGWSSARNLQSVPEQSFREWWRTRSTAKEQEQQDHDTTAH